MPYIKQDEPLKLECQHFIDCIRGEATPITGGMAGLEVVRILEASSLSLMQQGQAVNLTGSDGVKASASSVKDHPNGAAPAGGRSVLAA